MKSGLPFSGWNLRTSFNLAKKTQSSNERLGFFLPHHHSPPPKTYCEAHSGRFSGLRIFLLGLKPCFCFRPPCPFPPRSFDKLRTRGSGSGKFRTRLQRRGRPRISRGSLFGLQPPEHESSFIYPIPQFLSGCQMKRESLTSGKECLKHVPGNLGIFFESSNRIGIPVLPKGDIDA